MLLDLAIPGMDGIEILKKLKELDKDTNVIMITAYRDAEKVVQAFRLGAYDCIFKPFDFKYLRESLSGAKISADLFGYTTVIYNDLGIGQVIEDAYANFDYISPMVYPSHFTSGFIGYKSPAKYPYEVVKYSMEKALQRLKSQESGVRNSTTTITGSTDDLTPNTYNLKAKLRPWLQDFNLGATYDAAMVRKQIQATYDAFPTSSTRNQEPGTSNPFGGWLLWSAANIYTEGALDRR